MKASSIILSLALAVVSVSAAPQPAFGGGKFGQGNKGGNANANNNNNKGGAAAAAAASSSAAAAAAASASAASSNNAASGSAAGNNAGNATADNSDPQKSLTLDPKVIATGFENDGQDVQEAGQVPSLTSSNNFINFCLTVPNLPITNGKQITTGSCNPAPIGAIPAVGNMPSSKFTFPANGGSVTANQEFTISMAIQNMETGNFVNAQENYFAAPQQLNSQNQIIGHTHVVVETLTSLDQTTPTDPQKFAFFKGVNTAAQNGIVTADVTNGVPAGSYRLCSINSAANHQPVIVPIAQHGALDDCVYFTASANGGGNAGASNSTAAASSSGAAATNAGGNAAAGKAKGGKAAGGKGKRMLFNREQF